MAVEDNKNLVRAAYAALEKGDNSVFAASVHPDYVWRFPSKASWSGRFEGQAEIRARLLGPLFNLFATTYTARMISLVGEGDTVVAEIEGNVETKSGERYDNQYCMIFRFRDSRIVEVVEYCDTDLEERVLGPYSEALKAFQRVMAARS